MEEYRLEKVYSFWDNISAGVFTRDKETIIAIDANGNGLDQNDVFIQRDGSIVKPSDDQLRIWNSELTRWVRPEERQRYAEESVAQGDCIETRQDLRSNYDEHFNPPLSVNRQATTTEERPAYNPFTCYAAKGTKVGNDEWITIARGAALVHVEGELEKITELSKSIRSSELEQGIQVTVMTPGSTDPKPIRCFYYKNPEGR